MQPLPDRLLPDALWERIQPLLPAPPGGGAPRTVSDRACMAAILFMCRTSTPWALLPVREFGCGSVTTCWRRFAEWAHAGVFDRLQSCCWMSWALRGCWTGRGPAWTRPACALFGGDLLGANPVDRAKRGNKWHVANEASGMVLSLLLGPANRPDQELFEAVLDDIP